MYTLAWMVVGLIQLAKISLPEWIPFVESRAFYAQSTQIWGLTANSMTALAGVIDGMEHRLSRVFLPTAMDFSTWLATFGSGAPIATN